MYVEPDALKQLHNVASLPFIHKHVAVMPDVHFGRGATIGSVIPTKGAIVPAAVGVDLGCGMMACQTNLTASQLPDDLRHVRTAIEAMVPHGRTANGDPKNDQGAWNDIDRMPRGVIERLRGLDERYEDIRSRHPRIGHRGVVNHMGTLGTGNHFIELCLDENDSVWVMLHSGSRGPGNRIGSYFIDKAKEEMERYHIMPYLADKDLSYLVEYTELFDDYVEALMWAQDYAAANRKAMMEGTLAAMRASGLPDFHLVKFAVNCHHNYASIEHHYGENVWVTRKGAVRAREGDLGIIPGSMGAKSFIVRGKGNKDSFCSCSHGAGRKMSRTEARKTISLRDHAEATSGIECRVDEDVLDESPAAYKDIDDVMAAQSDLVEVVHTLRQIVNVKG
ncbi:RtcB family protein [Candidatus Macondimonas diazotrophica]|nr:RtcB family protein [Candidatus Macondimonas diazotrophica]